MSTTKFTRDNLVPNEKILYAAELHKFCYVVPTVVFVLGILMTFAHVIFPEDAASSMPQLVQRIIGWLAAKFEYVMNQIPPDLRPWVSWIMDLRRLAIGLLFIGIGSATLVNAYLKKISTEHTITNKKFILKKGFIAVDAIELSLDRIESVKVFQTMFDRMINRGRILVTGVGMEQIEIKNIANPVGFRKAALETIEKYVNSRGGK